MTIAELKEKNITELTKIARSLDLPGASGLRKQDLIFKILQAQSEKEGHIFAGPGRHVRFPVADSQI